MDWKKLWPTLIPVAGLIIETFSGQISSWLGGHPSVALAAVTIVTALANVVNPAKKDG